MKAIIGYMDTQTAKSATTAALPTATEQHALFPQLLAALRAGKNVYLLNEGPAYHSDKHLVAHRAARVLGCKLRPTYCLEWSFPRLLGFRDANGGYHSTVFRDWFEHGGLFSAVDFDHGTKEALDVLATALADGQCEFPDGARIKRHPDCLFVATGSTANSAGLDVMRAKLADRFVSLQWELPIAAELKREVSEAAKTAWRQATIAKRFSTNAAEGEAAANSVLAHHGFSVLGSYDFVRWVSFSNENSVVDAAREVARMDASKEAVVAVLAAAGYSESEAQQMAASIIDIHASAKVGAIHPDVLKDFEECLLRSFSEFFDTNRPARGAPVATRATEQMKREVEGALLNAGYSHDEIAALDAVVRDLASNAVCRYHQIFWAAVDAAKNAAENTFEGKEDAARAVLRREGINETVAERSTGAVFGALERETGQRAPEIDRLSGTCSHFYQKLAFLQPQLEKQPRKMGWYHFTTWLVFSLIWAPGCVLSYAFDKLSSGIGGLLLWLLVSIGSWKLSSLWLDHRRAKLARASEPQETPRAL